MPGRHPLEIPPAASRPQSRRKYPVSIRFNLSPDRQEVKCGLVDDLHEALQTCLWPIFVAEDGRPSDEDIGAGMHGERGAVHINAAVHLQLTISMALLEQLSRPLNLRQHAPDKALPPKAGVHSHHQQDIQLLDEVFERAGRR
jgi:hypothetical protein